MITECYVSFEVAKLLKEKGFEGDINAYYHIWDNGNKVCSAQEFSRSEAPHLYISAPTHQTAMKWLREVHNIQIELNWDKGNQLYSFQIWKLGKYQPEISSLDLWRIYKDDNYLGEWNYEEAVEAALKYCLENLI